MVQAVMSLHDGAKTRARVGSVYSEKFKKIGAHQGYELLPLLFAIVVDIITEKTRRDETNELLYADYLVLMSKTMEDLKKVFELEECTQN